MSADDLTQVRIAENQAAFRDANENIERAAGRIGVGGLLPFICECAEPACTEIVSLTAADYEEIRSDPRRFFNAHGHEAISVENGAGAVVEKRDGYVIVDKIGVAGERAAERSERG
jgi:hypothetical protein